MIRVGQVYRDTYGNGERDNKAKGIVNKRTIRIVSQEPDGRWLTETLTEIDGADARKSRKNRVSEKTLASGYVLERDAKA